MDALAPAYLIALATQIGGLSAFLGGFAATFLGTLLMKSHRSRVATVAIGFAAASSVAFIVAVVASTVLVAVLHPQAPVTAASAASPDGARAALALTFFLGLYALLVSLALSGWTRSHRTGWVTSIAALLGVVLVTWLVVGVS